MSQDIRIAVNLRFGSQLSLWAPGGDSADARWVAASWEIGVRGRPVMADLSLSFRRLRRTAGRRFHQVKVRPQNANEHDWETVATGCDA